MHPTWFASAGPVASHDCDHRISSSLDVGHTHQAEEANDRDSDAGADEWQDTTPREPLIEPDGVLEKRV